MKQFTTLHLESANNGIIVYVGCLTLVYPQENFDSLLADLKQYFIDPQNTEKLIRTRWDISQALTVAEQPEEQGETLRERWNSIRNQEERAVPKASRE